MTTASMATIEGFPVLIPNEVMEGDGFYISYNDYDGHIYGCDTTALVLGQFIEFFILNGDHRRQYAELMSHGFDACFEYFLAHLDQVNKFSSKPSARKG